MKLNIIIVLIRSHLFTSFKKKKTHWLPFLEYFDLKCFYRQFSPLNGRRTARIVLASQPWENWTCVETMTLGWQQTLHNANSAGSKPCVTFLSIFITNNNTFLLTNHVEGKETRLNLKWTGPQVIANTFTSLRFVQINFTENRRINKNNFYGTCVTAVWISSNLQLCDPDFCFCFSVVTKSHGWVYLSCFRG